MRYDENKYLDILSLEQDYNSQHLKLSKVAVGLESAVSLSNYIERCEREETPLSVDLVKQQIKTVSELTGLDETMYELTAGTESFGHSIMSIITGIFDIIGKILSSIIELIKTIIEKVVDFFKDLLSEKKKDKETTEKKLTTQYEATKAQVVTESVKQEEHGEVFKKSMDAQLSDLLEKIKKIIMSNPMLVVGLNQVNGKFYIEDSELSLSNVNSYLEDFASNIDHLFSNGLNMLDEKLINDVLFNSVRNDVSISGSVLNFLDSMISIPVETTDAEAKKIERKALTEFIMSYGSDLDESTVKLIEITHKFKDVIYRKIKDTPELSSELTYKTTQFLINNNIGGITDEHSWGVIGNNSKELLIVVSNNDVKSEELMTAAANIIKVTYGSEKGFDGSDEGISVLERKRIEANNNNAFLKQSDTVELFSLHAKFIKMITDLSMVTLYKIEISHILGDEITNKVSDIKITTPTNEEVDVYETIGDLDATFKELDNKVSRNLVTYKEHYKKSLKSLEKEKERITEISKKIKKIDKLYKYNSSLSVLSSSLQTYINNKSKTNNSIGTFLANTMKIIKENGNDSVYKLVTLIIDYKAIKESTVINL